MSDVRSFQHSKSGEAWLFAPLKWIKSMGGVPGGAGGTSRVLADWLHCQFTAHSPPRPPLSRGLDSVVGDSS